MSPLPILKSKSDGLIAVLKKMDGVLVAFSGGADSAFVLYASREALGNHVVALTAVSPSFPSHERDQASRLARDIGVKHVFVSTREMENPDYVKNPVNRCYFCKTELYRVCAEEARSRAFQWVVDGFNLDDEKDYRPGFKARSENQVRSPLIEAGLTKQDVRDLSRSAGLPTWDKPASPCLSSRIPYGIPVEEEVLKKIDRLEVFLRDNGLREFRLRYHRETARLEISPLEFQKMLEGDLRSRWIDVCKSEGFEYVTLDLEGFRSGRLNEAVGIKPVR